MSKPASRSLRSWLKNGNSENSPPNTPKSDRSSVAEKDKKTTPTHSTPGRRITRRNSHLEDPVTPVKTPLRNTRRASITEIDNKSVASPLRRSVRRLSTTSEDAPAPAKSLRKSVLIIDSPIKEENEKTAGSTTPPKRGRGRPRLVKDVKKIDTVEEVRNDVESKEKKYKRIKTKEKSASPTYDPSVIVIDDDDDGEVNTVGVIKKNVFKVDDKIKTEKIKEKAEETEKTLVQSELVGKKDDDKDQGLGDCVPKNGDEGVIGEKVTDTKTETGAAKVEEIHDVDGEEVILEKEGDDSMEAIVIREDVNEEEVDENKEIVVEDPDNISKKEEKGGKSQPTSSEIQEKAGEQRELKSQKEEEKLVEDSETIKKKDENSAKPQPPSSEKQRKRKSQKDFVEIISDEVELKDVSGRNNYNDEADTSVNAAERRNKSEKEEISDKIVETINNSIDEFFEELKEHEIVFKSEEDDEMEGIVISEDVIEKESGENIVEESEGISKEEEKVGQPLSDKQEETGEKREHKSQKDLVEIIADDIESNTNSIKDVRVEHNYNDADISVNSAEIINISEKEEVNDNIVETVNKSSKLSFTEQKDHESITINCDDTRDCSSPNEHNYAEQDHDAVTSKKEEDDSMEAIVIREDVNEEEGDDNNEKLVEESKIINKEEENGEKPQPASSDTQEESGEKQKIKSQKDMVEGISDDIKVDTNIQDVSGRNKYNDEADISVNADEIINISETEESNDSTVQTGNKSSQLVAFAEEKEDEITAKSREEKRDCSSPNERSDTVAEQDHDDEVISKKEVDDNMEAIVIEKHVNEKKDDENYEKLVEESESISKKEEHGGKSQPLATSEEQEETGEQRKLKSQQEEEKVVEESESINKKEENGGKSQPQSSEKQDETEEQQKIEPQQDLVDLISDDIELTTNNSIKEVSKGTNYKEEDDAEIINISETEEINDSIPKIVRKSPKLSFTKQKEHETITITCDEKEDCSNLSNNIPKNHNKSSNSFEQSVNQTKSPKNLLGNSEISNGEDESEINSTNGSCKKMKVRNDKSKIHKSVTFDDNTDKQLSIKYPTTPLAKGKMYSDSFMRTLRNIDSSYETSMNCNTSSASFKDSEENDVPHKMSIDVQQHCDVTSDCDTPYKNTSKKMKMSSSTPLSIFKQICMKKDDGLNHGNKSNEDLIMKDNGEGSFEGNKRESFSNTVNSNQKNNTKDISTNSLNEKELKITSQSQSCNKVEIEDAIDSTAIDDDDTQYALDRLFVSSESESGNECENDSGRGKNLEGVRGEIQGAEKDTSLCNNRKSNLENLDNLTQNEIVEKPIIKNDEDQDLTTNLEFGKDVNASKENSTYFKKNDDTPVFNRDSKNLEEEPCNHQKILLTTDKISPKTSKGTSENLNNTKNDDEDIHIIGVSNPENLPDNKETNTSNKGTTNISQKSAGNMNSELQSPERVSTNNDSKQNIESSKGHLNIFSECEETEEILNILKQDENSDIVTEANNQIETEMDSKVTSNDIVEDKDQDVLLEKCNVSVQKNTSSLLHKSSEKQNDSHIQKELNDSKIKDELLVKETRENVDCNLDDKELNTSNNKPGNRKSLSRRSSNYSSPSIKSSKLNVSGVGSILNGDVDRASPKIKNKSLINNKNGQEPPEQGTNIEEESNREENVNETISNLSSVDNNVTKSTTKNDSLIKNKSFDSSRKTKLCLLNESNLSLPFAGFDEKEITITEFDVSKLLAENKSSRRSSSPAHSLNETYTSVHHLDNINECNSNEENENVSNEEIGNKSTLQTAKQTKEPEAEVMQEIKTQSSSFEKNHERTATFLELKDTTSENKMKKTKSSENEIENEKLIKCSNDVSKRLSDLDTNSTQITTSNMKTTSENITNKVSQSTKSDNAIKGASSAKKHSKQQSKVKMAETESKAIINQENTSPASREKKLKRKLVAEAAKQNLTKVKKTKDDVIQSSASHRNMEKKLNKSNAKEIVQTGEGQSTLGQKQIAKENDKTKLKNAARKQKDRLLPDDILEAIDTQRKRSKKLHVDDSEGIKKSKTELRSESSSNKIKVSQSTTTGGISDIIKNPSGIFFEEPITPEKKHQSQSFKTGKRKILSTIELPTGVVYEEPVTPDHKKIVNGFKETAATPKAIGFKVKSILSAGQKEPPVYKKDTQKRRKLILDEPTTVLPKPKWAGKFTVTKYPKAINLDESVATEFLVTPLQPKKSKMEAGAATAAYEFKKGALYNKQIPRETSKQILQRKEKQKFYKF